ncbi:MAG: heavy metal translocating P-type ATPase [Clostridia bacterium]|nr:heavy metal translocating P-type ATPase [Clostridia bacterium]
MKKYNVTGMSCAACSTRVEKAVSALRGVDSCSVNLLTGSMTVEGSVSSEEVISAVVGAGYGAEEAGAAGKVSANRASGGEQAEKMLITRLVSSVILLLGLMYVSMGHVMWHWPLPEVLRHNPMTIGLIQLMLTLAVMVINQKFFINGFKGLLRRSPNMDTLVALGSFSAFGYSLWELFAMGEALYGGDIEGARHGLHGLYFESAAMILALITVGKMLEARAKGKTTDALESLMNLSPKTATVLRNGEEVVIPAEQVRRGDVFLLRPGQAVPVDGTVLEGHSAINESALTGESLPVEKETGSMVYSGTVNQSGVLRCEALQVGEDTTLSKIIKMVGDAASSKAPIAKVADKVSGIFVPVILILAAVTATVWLLLGESVGFSLARDISVLVISCPCALGLATPVAIMVGTGKGAKKGILFKTAAALEGAGHVNIVALDKTGTVTSGHPTVTDLIPAEGFSEWELLSLAASLEQNSEHPLAEAVRRLGEERGVSLSPVTDFEILPGNGLVARMGNDLLFGGNLAFVTQKITVSAEARQRAQVLSEEGKTPLFFGRNQELLGVVAVADTVKDDSAAAIARMKEMGLRVVMLTGDNQRTAAAIGARVGVDEVYAQVLPDGKEQIIRQLQQKGKVAMVGDGINDAPALTRADVGIAVGAGTDIAMDSADVVLMKSDLSSVASAILLGRKTLRNIHQNLFWAFFYNALCIPLAAGVFVPLGITLNPMIGAAAMSLSSVFVVGNALRLNRVKLSSPKEDSTEIKPEKEIELMKTILTVPDMMCAHCEKAIRTALSKVEGVTEIDVDLKAKTVAVSHTDAVTAQQLLDTVAAEDFHPTL